MTNKQKKVMTWQGSEGGVKGSQKMVTSFMDGLYRVCLHVRLLPLYVVHVPMYSKYTMTKGSALWFCLHTYLKGKREKKRYINGKVKAPYSTYYNTDDVFLVDHRTNSAVFFRLSAPVSSHIT